VVFALFLCTLTCTNFRVILLFAKQQPDIPPKGRYESLQIKRNIKKDILLLFYFLSKRHPSSTRPEKEHP
jgi:hypothetical protein